MAKMMHDKFEAWIRNDCRGCMEQYEVDALCEGDLDFESGDYTFRELIVQGQWEAWQAAIESTSQHAVDLSEASRNCKHIKQLWGIRHVRWLYLSWIFQRHLRRWKSLSVGWCPQLSDLAFLDSVWAGNA